MNTKQDAISIIWHFAFIAVQNSRLYLLLFPKNKKYICVNNVSGATTHVRGNWSTPKLLPDNSTEDQSNESDSDSSDDQIQPSDNTQPSTYGYY